MVAGWKTKTQISAEELVLKYTGDSCSIHIGKLQPCKAESTHS